MPKPFGNVPVPSSGQRQILRLGTVCETLLESAVDALIKSFLISLFGRIALGLAGGIWQQMTPSAPPGFENKPEAEAGSSGHWHSWGAALNHHQFLIIFGLIFVTTAWFRLTAPPGLEGGAPKAGSRLRRIAREASEGWFALIVGNAFGAMICALVLFWVQRFSIGRMLFGWLLGPVVPAFQKLLDLVLGSNRGESLRAWFEWYGQNQLKFTFWFFYLAAIGDDLGVPNFKTLGRWLTRRIRKRNTRDPKVLS